MNYSRFLTVMSQRREPSIIREAMKILATAPPELVFLGSGLPNPQLFPFEEVTIKLKNGNEITLDDKLMKAALQYGPTLGYPPLVEQLKSLTKRIHSPPCWDKTDLIITAGSQDGLAKSIEMLVNQGDHFITHEPVYTGTLSILNPLKPQFIPIKSDEAGMNPDALRKALSKWNSKEIRDQYDNVPKVIYINPNAVNPSGTSLTTERKKEIYKIASEYNLIILEDDPYYFLQFQDMKEFAPSFLSLDVDGRVLRFDSFSKIVSSGIRIGFVTGPRELIHRIELHMQSSVLHASAFSQVAVSELLRSWGEDGFLSHTAKVQEFYLYKRDIMLSSAKKYLEGLCNWTVPAGGMFLWLECPGLNDTGDMIVKRGPKKNVLLIPGKYFFTDSSADCNIMRASFSVASEEDIDKGMMYLSELIKEEIQLTKAKN